MPEPTTSNFSATLDTDVTLGGDQVNFVTLTSDLGVNASTQTISVAEDITGVNVPCYLLYESELIWATAKGSGDFTNCVRGAGGTTAAAHLTALPVYVVYAANLFNQLKRAIVAVETVLGIASASVIQTGKLDYPTSTELTIAAGSITPTQNWHTVDTEADAASDDLDTIVATNATDGFVLEIRPNNTARTIVVTTAGNIVTSTSYSITLDETYESLKLIYDATLVKWIAQVQNMHPIRFLIIPAIAYATDWSADGTVKVSNAIPSPVTGTIVSIRGDSDTAGTTGTAIVDVNLNGSTIMTTNKLKWDSTETSTATYSGTAPGLTTTTVTAGDLFTTDIDTNHTTKSKGLVITIGIRPT